MERMLALELRFDEAVVLKQILHNYLADLRMEIAGTDNYEMRGRLKGDEEAINRFIDRLDQMGVSL